MRSRLLFWRRRPLTCHEVGEVLQTYLDAELDDATAARVAAHLDDCRRCGLEAETYDELKASLRRRGQQVPAEPVARLRSFGERLSRGEIDPQLPPTGG